jgi:phage replication O-like protein O
MSVISISTARRQRMPDDKPELNDGYSRVVNVLAEGLASHPITSIQQRVLWAVIRMTYGWGKGKDVIAASQLAEITKMRRQVCSSALNELIEKGVIIREGGSRSPIKINTKIGEWSLPKKATKGLIKQRVTSKSNYCSLTSNSGHSTTSNSGHTKDKRNKDKNTTCFMEEVTPSELPATPLKPDAAIQNKSGNKYGHPIDLEVAELMARAIDANLGKDSPVNRDMADWANTIRLTREKDNREPAAIRALFAWANQDPFWSANIQSPKKLREKWSVLAAKRNSQRNGGDNGKNWAGGQQSDEKLTRQLTDLEYARENF